MSKKSIDQIPLDELPSVAQLIEKKKEGILIIGAGGEKQGTGIAKELLYEITDDRTVLFLSGGKTPAGLYSELARERRLRIGAAAMVDERFGKPLRAQSNQLMIEKSGLADYFKRENIPFYRILAGEEDIRQTALDYTKTVKYLFSHFPQSIAILGIGEDGHTAGIAPNRDDFINPLFAKERRSSLVSYFIDPKPMSAEGNSAPPEGFGKRITMTIKGLSKIDVLIVLVFGENKKGALLKVFEEGAFEQVPARLFKDKYIAGRTILITDQKV